MSVSLNISLHFTTGFYLSYLGKQIKHPVSLISWNLEKLLQSNFMNCKKRFRNCFYCSSLSKLLLLLFLLYSFYYRFNVLYVNWGRNIEPRRATIRTFLFICFGIEKFSTRCWKVNRKVKTWNNFDPLILKFDLEKALWSWYITVASSEHIKKKK